MRRDMMYLSDMRLSSPAFGKQWNDVEAEISIRYDYYVFLIFLVSILSKDMCFISTQLHAEKTMDDESDRRELDHGPAGRLCRLITKTPTSIPTFPAGLLLLRTPSTISLASMPTVCSDLFLLPLGSLPPSWWYSIKFCFRRCCSCSMNHVNQVLRSRTISAVSLWSKQNFHRRAVR